MEIKSGKMITAASCGVVLLALYLIKAYRRQHWISVKDKVVLITGATSGVGEACARKFFEAGAKLILCSRKASELERVKQVLMELKNGTSAERAHITLHEPRILAFDLEQLDAIPQKARQALSFYDCVDILINNGGISYRGEVMSTDLAVDMKVMRVNYFGQVALTKALLPGMIEGRTGHIVAVSSLQGKLATPFRSCYTASKHALQAFFDTLRSEVAVHNVKVSVISPGYIQTKLSINAVTGDGSAYGKMDATTAGGMLPDQVATEILKSVCSDQAEVILSTWSHKLAVYFRNLFPSIYFMAMVARAKKQRKSQHM